MRWASSISRRALLEEAVDEASDEIILELQGAHADLVVVFVSPHHARHYDTLPALLERHLGKTLIVGCSGGGVIGGGREVEDDPALSVTAAVLPGVDLQGFHLIAAPDRRAPASAWHERLAVSPASGPQFVLLADPFTVDTATLLEGLDGAYPGARKIGGLASGAMRPGENVLFLGSSMFREGVVGVALSGDIQLDTIVAQGCRPIAEPMPITRCENNVILELAGRRAVDVLKDVYESLDDDDKELFQHSLFVGLDMHSDRVEFNSDEFLVRNLMGVDTERGALAVGTNVENWQVLQFVLRDARTAAEDLTRLLDRYASERRPSRGESGALLFSCLGRGKNLFGRADHDTDLFRERIGEIPLGGFFCNGEIGPVGNTTFLHGYTSSFAIFRTRGGH